MSKDSTETRPESARLCGACKGLGVLPGKPEGSVQRCHKCHGDGRIRMRRQAEVENHSAEPKSEE